MKPSLLNKLLNVSRELGVVDSVLYLIQRLFARLPIGCQVYKYNLVAQPVPPSSSLRRHDLNIQQVSQNDYQYSWFPRPERFIDARFAQGATCFVAFAETKPIACLWIKQGSYFEDSVRAHFIPIPSPNAAWDFDVYVAPEYRLRRTFFDLWMFVFNWLNTQGITWTMSRIDAFNTASIQSHQRLGAQTVAQVVFWRFGKFQISVSSNTPRLTFSYDRVPEYEVHAPIK